MIINNKHKKLGTGLFSRKTGHVFFMIGESTNQWGVKSTALRSEEWWSKMWVDRMISLGQFGLIDTVLDADAMNHQEIDTWFENWHASETQSV